MIAWEILLSRAMSGVSSLVEQATQIDNPEGLPILFGEDFSSPFSTFGTMWMPVVGIILIVAGAWMLRAGYLSTTVRYVAGETMPVVKDSASYLTDGEGFMGIGKLPNAGTESVRAQQGLYCRDCGGQNAPAARFCSNCGRQLLH